MRSKVERSVVIPAYNEAGRIRHTLEAVITHMVRLGGSGEIIVVSDGSMDGTEAVVRTFQGQGVPIRVLRNGRNRGKGASVRRGVAAARGEIILFSDADLSTPIEEMTKLEAVLQAGAAVAIGSRAIQGAVIKDHQPFYREWMGKTFNLFVQTVVLPGIKDTQCGFKLFERKTARKVFANMTIAGFGFDVEILYLARRLGADIREVPVAWDNVLGSKVSPLRHSIQMFFDLFRVRWRHGKTFGRG